MVKLAAFSAVMASLTAAVAAAPGLSYKGASDVPIPVALLDDDQAQCNKDSYTCSQCTECCLVKFTTAEQNGCDLLEDPQAPIYQVYKPDQGCQNLLIGMHAAKIHECTGYFEGCIMWSELDCKGVQDTLYNKGSNCRTPFLIKSMFCYGIWQPQRNP